jgi:hemolysin D
MKIDGKQVNLTPGMAAVAEIKTGKRKLIEYLLSPLKRMTDEAGRER